jgi:hypothetical protein
MATNNTEMWLHRLWSGGSHGVIVFVSFRLSAVHVSLTNDAFTFAIGQKLIV